MKKQILQLLILLNAAFSCSCSDNTWSDNKGNTIIGTWEKLTITNNADSILYNCFDATNAKIVVDKDKNMLYVNYGQEDITYDIRQVRYTNGEFIIDVQTQDGYGTRQIMNILKCKITDNNLAYWDYYGDGAYSINGVYNLFTLTPNKYKTILDMTMQEDYE